jgi:hypothetical protein
VGEEINMSEKSSLLMAIKEGILKEICPTCSKRTTCPRYTKGNWAVMMCEEYVNINE